MQNVINMVNGWFLAAYYGVKGFINDEITRIKEDESGMEMVQVILILLMVVIIAAALWAFLGDVIKEWLGIIDENTQYEDPGMNPRR